jgi:Coenzyme PQQ synthesis protein D (PqqD)
MGDMLDVVFSASSPEVIFENFGDEMVVANLESGFFYSLDGSGADIWNALIAGHTGRQFAAATSADVDGAAAIARFIAELRNERLLVETDRLAKPDLLSVAVFAPPSMQRFDDLQGLLLVDPIHEASPAGWPFVEASQDGSRG